MSVVLPMCLMALLTLAVAPYIFFTRVKAVRRGQIDLEYFRLGQKSDGPDAVVQSTRHFSNLFEVPVLFYAGCLAVLVLEQDGSFFAALAWLYFLLRMVHTFIHLSYNKVQHRLVPFVLSNVTMVVFWVRLCYKSGF